MFLWTYHWQSIRSFEIPEFESPMAYIKANLTFTLNELATTISIINISPSFYQRFKSIINCPLLMWGKQTIMATMI